MNRFRRVALPAGLFAAAALVASCVPSGHSAATFSSLLRLPQYAGGEPSIATSTRDVDVYVTAPQGIPSAVGGAVGGAGNGIGFWASYDAGKTFPLRANVGSTVGGG